MEGIEQIVAGARSILAASLFTRTDAESLDAVRAMEEASAIVEAARLRLIADLDSRPSAVPHARAGKGAEVHLNHLNVSRGQAARDVAAARALEGPLPQLGEAFAAGEINRAHVDVGVRTLTRVPSQFTGPSDMRAIDTFLADQARSFAPKAYDRAAKELLQRIDPDGSCSFDPEAYLRRGLSLTQAADGMLLIRGQVAGIAASWVKTTLESMAKPDPIQEDDQGALIPDMRTKSQRLADALTDLCHSGSTPAQVTIVATLDQATAAVNGDLAAPVGLADEVSSATGVNTRTLAQHLCGALIRSFSHCANGDLNLGYTQRLATPRQKAALIARDRGCIIPGCPAPAGTCDAHHVRAWTDGGPTDIANLALLCRRHHTEVHLKIWTLTVQDGVAWAVPPRYYDPHQRPRRNTLHQAREDARAVAEQLRLDVPDTS